MSPAGAPDLACRDAAQVGMRSEAPARQRCRVAPHDPSERVAASGLHRTGRRFRRAFGQLFLGLALMIACGTAACAAPAEPSTAGIDVKARKEAGTVVIDVDMTVEATPRQAWDVLTDYDHMTQFLPNLRVSRIVSRSPTRLQVAQKGGVSHGPLSITFDVIRDVQLKPFEEVVSRVISGDLKQVDSITRLKPEGGGTRITFHSVSIPNVWVPPGIGPSLIEGETRDQFADIRAEILRRKAPAGN